MVVLRTEKLWYVVVTQSVHLCRQFLTGGVLYETLGFVGSYDSERCALLLLLFLHNLVVLKIKGDYYVGYVKVMVL